MQPLRPTLPQEPSWEQEDPGRPPRSSHFCPRSAQRHKPDRRTPVPILGCTLFCYNCNGWLRPARDKATCRVGFPAPAELPSLSRPPPTPATPFYTPNPPPRTSPLFPESPLSSCNPGSGGHKGLSTQGLLGLMWDLPNIDA